MPICILVFCRLYDLTLQPWDHLLDEYDPNMWQNWMRASGNPKDLNADWFLQIRNEEDVVAADIQTTWQSFKARRVLRVDLPPTKRFLIGAMIGRAHSDVRIQVTRIRRAATMVELDDACDRLWKAEEMRISLK